MKRERGLRLVAKNQRNVVQATFESKPINSVSGLVSSLEAMGIAVGRTYPASGTRFQMAARMIRKAITDIEATGDRVGF